VRPLEEYLRKQHTDCSVFKVILLSRVRLEFQTNALNLTVH